MGRYWLQTLGCPKNQVDSDKLEGYLEAQGYVPASGPEAADLVVVNTCAFIDAARQESIDTVLDLADGAAPVHASSSPAAWPSATATSCAMRCPRSTWWPGSAADLVAPAAPSRSPFRCRRTAAAGPRRTVGFDLLELPRPAARAPWAYVKVAEGCDRICGFCAIPSFRGKQRSRSAEEILAEVDALSAGRGRTATDGRRCARSCWSRRTSPPTGATAPAPAAPAASPAALRRSLRSLAAWPHASTAPGCSISIPRA